MRRIGEKPPPTPSFAIGASCASRRGNLGQFQPLWSSTPRSILCTKQPWHQLFSCHRAGKEGECRKIHIHRTVCLNIGAMSLIVWDPHTYGTTHLTTPPHTPFSYHVGASCSCLAPDGHFDSQSLGGSAGYRRDLVQARDIRVTKGPFLDASLCALQFHLLLLCSLVNILIECLEWRTGTKFHKQLENSWKVGSGWPATNFALWTRAKFITNFSLWAG